MNEALARDGGLHRWLQLQVGKTAFEMKSWDQWRFTTRESFTESVIAALDPDDDQEWYDWVVGRLHTLGIEVDPGSVETAPYRVEFGNRVLEELQKRGR